MDIILKDDLVHKADLFTIAIHYPWSFVDFWDWKGDRNPLVPTSGTLSITTAGCSAI
jgi:hypothetical protein